MEATQLRLEVNNQCATYRKPLLVQDSSDPREAYSYLLSPLDDFRLERKADGAVPIALVRCCYSVHFPLSSHFEQTRGNHDDLKRLLDYMGGTVLYYSFVTQPIRWIILDSR
jgi:hypothetical protein